MKKLFSGFIILFFPSFLARLFLKLFGHKIKGKVKFGFSIVLIDKLNLESRVKIGHFNIIRVPSLTMKKDSYIGNFNTIKGPIDIDIKYRGAIGKSNTIFRGPLGVTYGKSTLTIGEISKITYKHYVDCTRSISMGDNSILAGSDSQLWTHGYVHDIEGPKRYRIDGEIEIGNNVYIGSRCTFNAGVKIADGITLGSGTVVSKSLTEQGLYVNQPLRFIEKKDFNDTSGLTLVKSKNLVETVYEKQIEDSNK